MVKLVDTPVLETGAARHESSSLSLSTIHIFCEYNFFDTLLMNTILLWAELVVSILLAIVIILQPKSSSGMGSMAGEDSAALTSKRGGEQVLHIITIILAILFAAIAFLYHFV